MATRLGSTDRAPAQAMVQFAIASAVLLGVIVTMVDVVLWLHAQNIVVAAAQEAATIASREDGTVASAQQRATELLRAALGSEVAAIEPIQIRVDGDTATAEVRGAWRVPPLGPLVRMPLRARASVAREVFRPGGR